ncbi:hypothetical protein Zmor_024165 [Zophobas morio]|uniref:Uncharacterized protein n=1 Tax=Zophobas morio TaxID=2755281 RepID=A0AA38M7W2_9CUCU|nr:hypothetical protein Zmor_024165 [Zophobas morio]
MVNRINENICPFQISPNLIFGVLLRLFPDQKFPIAIKLLALDFDLFHQRKRNNSSVFAVIALLPSTPLAVRELPKKNQTTAKDDTCDEDQRQQSRRASCNWHNTATLIVVSCELSEGIKSFAFYSGLSCTGKNGDKITSYLKV